MKAVVPVFFACLSWWLSACSSPSFDIGGAADSGEADSQTPTDSGTIADSDPPMMDAPPCGSESAPLEIWVDAAATLKPTGERGCPFPNIADAVAYAAKLAPVDRTIRVVAGTYREARAVRVPKQLTLIGAGPSTTIVTGGGNCNETGDFQCIIRLDGARMRDIQVRDLSAETSAGIAARGGSVVGPNVWALNNGQGLVTAGPGDIRVAGSGNRFDENTSMGIFHAGTGRLFFEGGSANKNVIGVRIGSSVIGPPGLSEITNLTATSNSVGLRITADGSARVRKSTFTGNRFGVIAIFGVANELDLGTASSGGGNSFGNSASANKWVGVCVQNATRSLPLVGNQWPSCALTKSASMVDCDAFTFEGTYYDALYRGSLAPDTGGCSVAP